MEVEKDHNELELRLWRIERILDIFFSDQNLSEKQMDEVRQWLVQTDLSQQKEMALSDKFQAVYSPGRKSRYAKELWPVIASRLGFTPDLNALLEKAPDYSSPEKGERLPRTDDRIARGSSGEKKTIFLLKRWSVRIAAIIIPSVVMLGAYSYFTSEMGVPGNLPANSQNEIVEIPAESRDVIPSADTLSDEKPLVAVAADLKSAPAEKQPERNTPPAIDYDLRFNAPQHQSKYVSLPDNSTVIINHGGTVEFSTKNRQARLIGEAYFIVAKGSQQTFRVKTEYCTVNVTGTEFNVKAMAGADESVVDLVKGSLEVDIPNNTVSVAASQQLRLENKNGAVTLRPIPAGGWWEQPLVFDSKSISEILELIESNYSVKIQGAESLDDTLRYTIKFDRREPIEQVMKMLTRIAPGFEYEGDHASINVRMNLQRNDEY